MYHKIAVGLALVAACAPTNNSIQTKDIAMNAQGLVIKARCRESDPCVFDGRDMFLDIEITNARAVEVGFPLEYVQKTGPIIKLINTRDKAETYLKRNLADPALLERLTPIRPGTSAAMEWVITSDEVQRFGDELVDLFAEITIMAEIEVDGAKTDFRGAAMLRITSKDKP